MIEKALSEIDRLCKKFNLRVFLCDVTNITAIIRFGLEIDVFIQVYINVQKRNSI